ncbi:hypothetical protein [Chamaesiphon polymorphus]|uniref:Uncharacterized protein n=1 Tax=Chamaesiphon polymorphus CCALA 037 TaxID=2107692 RepID=A0A2T1G2S0_9CYAN|nr:hypothetical protein [Chamaesiphon polymorphus]PSB51549.1 hypothetical protein C7B77_21500 [Chamaesiphon polymorphus CCALA 037]
MQKFWQYTTTTFLTLLSSSLPAWSLNAPIDRSTTPRSIESSKIALQRTTCVRLTFSNGASVHAGQLWLNSNGMGRMTVKFFSPQLGRQESVDQIMRTENSAQGILLVGSDPVYSGTRRRHPNYSPDNFLLRIDENGRRSFFTFDLNRNVSAVEIDPC